MKHLFVPYEIAKQLKEKGFNEPCFCEYAKEIKTENIFLRDTYIDLQPDGFNRQICEAPLYQQVIDWFREKHNIAIGVFNMSRTQCAFDITFLETYPEKHEPENTYGGVNTKQVCNELLLKEERKIKLPSIDEIAAQNYSYYEALTKAIEEALKLI